MKAHFLVYLRILCSASGSLPVCHTASHDTGFEQVTSQETEKVSYRTKSTKKLCSSNESLITPILVITMTENRCTNQPLNTMSLMSCLGEGA